MAGRKCSWIQATDYKNNIMKEFILWKNLQNMMGQTATDIQYFL